MKKIKDSWALSAGDRVERPWGRATSSHRRASPHHRLAALARRRGRAAPACARRRGRPGGIAPEEVAAAGPLRHREAVRPRHAPPRGRPPA